jgi:hypothetical protein
VTVTLVISGVLMLGMLAASGYGAVWLPAGARIPVHCGSAEHCYLAPKRAGLVIWPVIGALAFAVLGAVTGSSLASDWTAGVRDVITPAVLCVALGFQVGALILAGRGSPGEAG